MAKKQVVQLDERASVAEEVIPSGLARPPIVAVMGHVDHGKTTLLDFLRKTNVASREAGGITQSIGAYEVEHAGKKITFLDTPGHEAFTGMRKRGATVADIAIVVVAADDSVKPQTKEVIRLVRETNTPFIIAINKIDKPNVDVERVKTDLMKEEVLLEGFGGDVSWQAISAKTGQGIQELLDHILLTAEVHGLTYDAHCPAEGVVIEAKMDGRRGIMVSGILKNGTLRVGDALTTPTATGTIRAMENFLGARVTELLPSSPVLISGFDTLPLVGEPFTVGGVLPATPSFTRGADVARMGECPTLNVVVKADVAGSLEALLEIVRALPQDDVMLRIIHQGVGEITDGDVRFAAPSHALILGFGVAPTKAALNLLKSHDLAYFTSKIIYDIQKRLQEELASFGKPKPVGELSVLAVFSQTGLKQLVGGKVISGAMKHVGKTIILREGKQIGAGKVTNLRSGKKEVKQALAGEECGVMIEAETPIQVGDVVQIIKEA